MHWKLKARVFRVLEITPFGQQLHFQLQKRVTKEWPRPSVALDLLLAAARRVREACPGSKGGRLLEIGAGNDFAVAVALRLLGAQHVTCVDVSRLARPELIGHAAAYMAERLGLPTPALKTWADIEAFGISYRAPTTLPKANLAPEWFDGFFTIDTLEQIPREDLRGVILEASGCSNRGPCRST
jgi:uncharacterized UPF0146 family protein